MPRYNWKNVQNYYDHPHSKEDTQKAFKMHKGTWYDAVKRKAIILREEDYVSNSKYVKKPIEVYLVNPSNMDGTHLKRRLLKEGLLEDKCLICGLTEWCGMEISLHLDHINGNKYDNTLKNLRILCPNCHSQTSTYCGRNAKYE